MKRQKLAVAVIVGMGVSLLSCAAIKTPEQKISYAMGFETGMAMHKNNIKLNMPAYSLGLQEGLQGTAKSMSLADIKKAIVTFQKEAIAKFKAKVSELAATNLQKSNAFLQQNTKNKDVKTLANGLQYKIITPGTGATPKLTDKVTVDYTGKLINGHVFDSSYKRGEKATFPLNAVIKGWQTGITKMREGATWEFYIPPALAYGKTGAPGIGPNEALIFDVHLYKVN